jgi:hypothetical protein
VQKRWIISLLVISSLSITLKTSAEAANPPIPYTNEACQRLEAATLKIQKLMEKEHWPTASGGNSAGIEAGIRTYRDIYEMAGYSFDQSLIHFASAYKKNSDGRIKVVNTCTGVITFKGARRLVAEADHAGVNLHKYFSDNVVAALHILSGSEGTSPFNISVMAEQDSKNAFTAAMAFFYDHPDNTVTMKDLKQNGYEPTLDVNCCIVDGTRDNLTIITGHGKGDWSYKVDDKGAISIVKKPLSTSKDCQLLRESEPQTTSGRNLPDKSVKQEL